MFELILIIALLGLGACFALIAVLDAGMSQAGRYGLLALATLSWLAAYPFML
jgi:hypothetical protein